MSRTPPITRQQLLDPEGFEISQLLDLARSVMRRVLLRRRVDGLSVQAARSVLEHYEPKPTISATITGPVILTWNSESPSPTPLGLSAESSTTLGDDNGHAPVSSSATDSLENL